MITYSVAQVEALTGIKAHTLRIWERRYDFLTPERTSTNIRFYSDEQLKKLLNFGILVKNGYRVSKIERMSDEEVHSEVLKVMSDPTSEMNDELKGLTLCMLEMNEEEFDNIFERQVIRKGFLRAITEVVYPFLEYVGVLWTTNKAMVAQEHYISNLIRQKLISAIERLSLPSKDAPSIVFFLSEGEEHEIGLLLASFMAKSMGWNIYYLGQSVPLVNIKKVIEIAEPSVIMSMFVTPRVNKINSFIDAVMEGSQIPYIVSGSVENLEAIPDSDLLIKVASPNEFESHLGQMYEAKVF